MVIVAVAGGTGDMGKLIADALIAKGGHQVYVMSRKAPPNAQAIKSPDGQSYDPVIVTDYADEGALTALLEEKSIHTIISALSMSSPQTADAQRRLICAAAASNCVSRFAPSEFNVDYDLPDSILPYPDKQYHVQARRQLEETKLEYTLFVCGMFMDYYGIPNIDSPLKPTFSILDLQSNRAAIPGDGQAILATTLARDVARFVAAAVGLAKWHKVFTIVGSQISVSDLVSLAIAIKQPEQVQIERHPVEDYLSHKVPNLPSNDAVADEFPGGEEALRSLLCDLDAAIALGAYDVSKIEGAVDLVNLVGDDEDKPVNIQQLLREAWGQRH